MATAIPLPNWQTDNNDGSFASGGKIFFWVPGTSTPRTPFSDTALTVPTTNPVLLNSAGWPATSIYLSSELAYEYEVKSADESLTYVPRRLIPSNASGSQPVDATLTALAGLTIADGDFIQGTGADSFRTRKVTVATYAALTAIVAGSRFDDMLVYVASRTTDGDGGEGWWRFDAASSATANGGTILAPDAGTGRWFRLWDGINLEAIWFGLKGDDSSGSASLNTTVLTALDAFTAVIIHLPGGGIRHNGFTWNTGEKTVIGVRGSTFLSYTGTTGDDWTLGDGTTEVQDLYLRDIDLWPVSAKASGWAINARRLVRSQFAGVTTSSFQRYSANGNVSKSYGGFRFAGYDRVELTEGSEHWGGHTGLLAFGEASSVRGAELSIDESCRFGGASYANHHLAGGGNLYSYAEISGAGAAGQGVRIDRSILNEPNREVFLGAIIDACGEEGIYVAADSLALLDIQGLWLASNGQSSSGVPGLRTMPSTTVFPKINATGARIYNQKFDGVQLNACASATFAGATFLDNGTGAAGGVGLHLANSGANNVAGAGAVFANNGNGTLGVGLKIASGVDNFDFLGSVFSGNGTAAVDNAAGIGPTKRIALSVGHSASLPADTPVAQAWSIDTANAGLVTIAGGANHALAVGASGFIWVHDNGDGLLALFAAYAGVTAKIFGDAKFVANAGPGATEIGVGYDGSTGYRVYNGTASSRSFYIGALRTRPSS